MARGSEAEKEKKRRAVAKGVVEGKPLSKIAREAGCHKRYAQKLSKEPETRFLIAAMLVPHREKLAKLGLKAILVVNRALGAQRTDKADHIVRLRAVERYRDLLELAQGTKDPEADERLGLVTWPQFTALYMQRTQRRVSGE